MWIKEPLTDTELAIREADKSVTIPDNFNKNHGTQQRLSSPPAGARHYNANFL